MYAPAKRSPSMSQVIQDTGIAAAKAAPAVVVAATGATGAVDWTSVAYMLTALYMVLQIFLLVPKYRQMFREWRQPGCNK